MSTYKNTPQFFNGGDTVTAVTTRDKLKKFNAGWKDLPSLQAWLDDDGKSYTKHLGLITTFNQMFQWNAPMYSSWFKDGAILEVNGLRGKFKYEYPTFEDNGIYTISDTSNGMTEPGIDGSLMELDLPIKLSPNSIVYTHLTHGDQLAVSEDHQPEKIIGGWKNYVYLTNDSESRTYDPELLKKDVQYFVGVDTVVGEFTRQFGAPTYQDSHSTITAEFELGGGRGLQATYSAYADSQKFSGAELQIDKYIKKAKQWEKTFGGDLVAFAEYSNHDVKDGKVKYSVKEGTMRISSVLEAVVRSELMKQEAWQNMFQKGGRIQTSQGFIKLNEGIYRRARRGNRITFSRNKGISVSDLVLASNIIHQSRPDLDDVDKYMVLTGGRIFVENIHQIIQEEGLAQLDNLSSLLGDSNKIDKPVVDSSKGLTELEVKPVRFTKAYIKGVGTIEVVHDPTFDYTHNIDPNQRNYGRRGLGDMSQSGVIWDISSKDSTSALVDLPSNVNLVDENAEMSNVFYVKPEGRNVFYGQNEGRYSQTAGSIPATNNFLGTTTWAWSVSAGWLRDITKTLVFEPDSLSNLDKAYS